jgi:hypothetical protein
MSDNNPEDGIFKALALLKLSAPQTDLSGLGLIGGLLMIIIGVIISIGIFAVLAWALSGNPWALLQFIWSGSLT